MSLPVAVVERLFQRLTATYGAEFVNKWDKVSLTDLKTAWSYELAFCADNLNMIGWALENLPARCPNLIEFKLICKQAPRDTNLALNSPKAPTDIVDKELARMALAAFKLPTDTQGTVDHKRWAKRLKAKHEAGEKLSIYQIKCYKTALDMLS